MNLNDIMGLRANMQFFQSVAGAKGKSNALFQDSFSDKKMLDLKESKVDEVISRLRKECGSDPKVETLASDWAALRSKMKSSTCGEIKDVLQKVISEVTAIYQDCLDKVQQETSETEQSPSEQTLEEINDSAEQQWHAIKTKEAVKDAAVNHPQTLLTFLNALRKVEAGQYGQKLAEALANRDSALFNMQTLLLLSLIEGAASEKNEVIRQETFKTFSERESAGYNRLIVDLKEAGPPFLEKVLYNPDKMNESDRALQSRVNSCIANSDMTYEIAQGVNYFAGTRLESLGEAVKQAETWIIIAPMMEQISKLSEDEQGDALIDLAKEFIEAKRNEMVIVILGVIERFGGSEGLNSFFNELRPSISHSDKATYLIANFDNLEPFISKIDAKDRDSLLKSIFLSFPFAPPHQDLHDAIDANIPKLLDQIKDEKILREALGNVLVYYSRNRENTVTAETLLNNYIHDGDQQKEVITLAAINWNDVIKANFSTQTPSLRGWKAFVDDFLPDRTIRAEVKEKVLEIGGGIMLDEEAIREINSEWDAINE